MDFIPVLSKETRERPTHSALASRFLGDNTFLQRLRQSTGQALIECALGLPLLFLLILNVVNFGGFFYAWITVSDAARSGANYAALSGASAGDPATPTLTQLTSTITKDLSSLPNGSGAAVSACEKIGSASATKFGPSGGTCPITVSVSDPDGVALIAVQVQYSYTPFFSAFDFPRLGVNLTLPPTTITQTAYMRAIQ